jgi:hypothetical protein
MKILPLGQTFIHHGPNVQPTHDAKGGIAIFLSPEFAEQWRKGGSKKKGGTCCSQTTRFMAITIKFNL